MLCPCTYLTERCQKVDYLAHSRCSYTAAVSVYPSTVKTERELVGLAGAFLHTHAHSSLRWIVCYRCCQHRSGLILRLLPLLCWEDRLPNTVGAAVGVPYRSVLLGFRLCDTPVIDRCTHTHTQRRRCSCSERPSSFSTVGTSLLFLSMPRPRKIVDGNLAKRREPTDVHGVHSSGLHRL